jgi:hypothetical protein
VPIAELTKLRHHVPQAGHVAAHLMRDAAVGQRDGEVVRMIDGTGELDGSLAAELGVVVVAQQPVRMRSPGHAVISGRVPTLSDTSRVVRLAASSRCRTASAGLPRLRAEPPTAK